MISHWGRGDTNLLEFFLSVLLSTLSTMSTLSTLLLQQDGYLFSGQAFEQDGGFGEGKGGRNITTGSEGIVEAHGEDDGRAVIDGLFHADDIRHGSDDSPGLGVGITVVEKYALDTAEGRKKTGKGF